MGEMVLVTGGSGFVATHCILQLLQAGHRVRTTVRSPKREAEVRAALRTGGVDPGELSFGTADLLSDAGWPRPRRRDFVLHVARPSSQRPKDESGLIVPARRSLRAGPRAMRREAGALTSSFAAVGYGQCTARPF
jgi:dihydroflavonol-4-reductase